MPVLRVCGIVASLLGVVLIAKPTFLFGGSEHTDAGTGAGGRTVTETQRMIAVGYVGFTFVVILLV
jgi:hypothetical protein